MESFGSRLRAAREKKNVKQNKLCKDIGINQSVYSRVENGKYDIPLSLLFLLSHYLDVSIPWLLGLDGDNDFTKSEFLDIEKYKQFIKYRRNK